MIAAGPTQRDGTLSGKKVRVPSASLLTTSQDAPDLLGEHLQAAATAALVRRAPSVRMPL